MYNLKFNIMKKLLVTLICGFFVSCAVAQTHEIPEPQFVGDVIAILPDSSTLKLEKQSITLETRANAALYLFSVGKIKTKIVIENAHATSRFNSNDEIRFIVKSVDNESDPNTFIKIFQFDVKKHKRLAELESSGTFSGVKSGQLELLDFAAEKYGKQSYLITLLTKPAGEYGIIINNPNTRDEKSTVVSTFAIDSDAENPIPNNNKNKKTKSTDF